MLKKNFLILASAFCLISASSSSAFGAAETSTQKQDPQVQQKTDTKTDVASSPQKAETAPTIQVTEAWARKSLSPNNNSAAYMKISNIADKDMVIIGASASDIANNVELHKSFVDEKGISRMATIDKIVVPAKTVVELAPSSMHIMLFDLKRNLNTGDKFKLELKLDGNSEPVIVEVEVKEGK